MTLGVILIAFAVANRQAVTVSFDPFNTANPAASVALPLFALVIVLLIAGVVIGGSASWLRHGRWRRTARRLERDLTRLREELEAHKRAAAAAPVHIPRAVEPPERLKLKPPVQ
ncbi:MAG: LapA family protein [Xanthobacteraceae bacterium]